MIKNITILFAVAATLVTCSEKNKTRTTTPTSQTETSSSAGGGEASTEETQHCGGCACDVR